MYPLHHTPPDKMTPLQRREEIAALLANGLIRLREHDVAITEKTLPEKGLTLGFAGQTSVHTHRVIPLSAEIV